MKGERRHSILVLTALLFASCGPVPTTASPAGSDAALATRFRATPFPIATPRYTMPPANSLCPTLNALYRPPLASLEFLTAAGYGEPAAVAVGHAPLVVPFRPANPDHRGGGSGVLLGDRAQQMVASVFYENAEQLGSTAQITSLELALELPGEATRSLSVTAAGIQRPTREFVVAGVPDTDSEGALHVRMTWADRCYQYIAEGTMMIRVAGVATVARCAVGQEAWVQLGDLLAPPLAFGNARAQLGLTSAQGLLIETPIIDGPYPAMMFDRAAPVATAGPGEIIEFHATNPELVLGVGERATLVFYPRDGVIRHIDSGGYYGGGDPIPAPVLESEYALEDGLFQIHAPELPGRYVVGISLDFTSACFRGSVVAGAGLDVVAP